MGSSQPMISNPEGVPIISDTRAFSTMLDEYSKKHPLSYKNYFIFESAMTLFCSELKKHLPSKPFKPIIMRQIESSFFNYLDPDLSTEKLFNLAMAVYHRIGFVYGTTHTYPKKELEKINYSLIAKYSAYIYENEDEATAISEKIIKKINFMTEEFPLKLFHIINIIKNHCGYVYGYDKEYNLNFYIEHFKVGYENNISYIDYVIYIVFVIEIVLPLLKKNKFTFNDKINVIINFNGDEPNTELITFLITYLNNFYPLMLNRMHIINFDIKKLKTNKTFKEDLDKIDYFRFIYFQSNKTFTTILAKTINVDMLPSTIGGNAKIEKFSFGNEELKEENVFKLFSKYIAKSIFALKQ